MSKTTLIIIALAALTAAFSDKDDLSRLSLVMRQDDVLKVDMRKLISFRSSSINFFSNNPQVKLPGVSKKPPKVFETERKFAPVIFKSKKGRVFMVEEDRSKLHMWDLIGKTELRPMPHRYKFEVIPDFKLVIADIHLEDDYMTILFYDARDHENPSKQARPTKYYLFNVNMWEANTQAMVKFTGSWCEKPTLKLFSPHPEGKSRKMTFLVFDKNSKVDGEFSNKRSFDLVNVDFASTEEEIKPSDVVTKRVNEVVFNRGNEEISLKNILMTTQGKHNIFFVVQEKANANTRRQSVYRCSVDWMPEADRTTFSKCELFKKEPIKEFFLKGQNYIAITESNKMEFCNHVANSCRDGAIQETWELKSVLMEADTAVIIMAIDNTKFVFINDFKENSLVWFYDDSTPILPSFLLFGTVREKLHTFLAEIPEKGLSFRDVTFYPYFKVKGMQLKQDLLTNVYLEDKLVLSYDLKALGDQKVKNLQEDRIVSVLTEPKSREFRTKIDLIGSNMRFPENGLAKIKYFNQMAVQVRWEPEELKGQPHHFYKDWMFFAQSIVKLNCLADKEHYVYYCEEQGKFKIEKRIDVKAIQSVEELGSIIALVTDKSDSMIFFDKIKGELLPGEYPARFLGGEKCMVFQYYVACAYTIAGDVTVSSIRVFWIKSAGLVEIDEFESSFLASLDQFKKQSEIPSEKVVSITISSFDFDNVQTDRLAVLLILAFEDNNTRAVYANYVFNHNPNMPNERKLLWAGRNERFERDAELGKNTKMIVLDSQTVFYQFHNRFDLFCYDADSKYFFEYLDVTELISVRLINTHSLIIVVFRGHMDRFFFAIFKITQNAAKQLIRLEEIPYYDDNYVMSTIVIDDWTLGFYQYNAADSSKEYPSYMYFRNGPILVSSTFEHQMMVSNTPVVLRFAQDKLFDITRNKMIKPSTLEVRPESPALDLPIKDHFSFDGNMYDIEPNNDAKALGIELEKPLTRKTDEVVAELNALTEASNVQVFTSPTHVLVQEDKHRAIYRLFSREDDTPEVKIDFTNKTPSCDRIVLSVLSVLCFYSDAALPMLAKIPLKGSRSNDQTFVLPEPMADIKVLSDNASKLTLLYRDVWGKYLSILELNVDTNSWTRRFIGKKEMNVDDLNILDFFSELNETINRLTIIILDGHSNQLLFYHASTLNYIQEPILKRNVYLGRMENAGYKLKCQRASATDLKFNCMLFSSSRMHFLKISNVKNPKVSLFTWEVTDTRQFYNVLFATALDNTLNVRAVGDAKNFFIFQKDIRTASEPMLIRYNLENAAFHHSSFALPLKEYKEIIWVDSKVSEKTGQLATIDEVEVYHVNANALRRLVLKTGDYVLHHPKPFDLDGKRIVLNSFFFNSQNANDFAFTFAQKKGGVDEAKKTRNIKIVLLIVAIILVAVFILIALFALLVLLRDRKKIQAGPTQTADETEVDISYM